MAPVLPPDDNLVDCIGLLVDVGIDEGINVVIDVVLDVVLEVVLGVGRAVHTSPPGTIIGG